MATCEECRRTWNPRSTLYSPRCPQCRKAAAGPTRALLGAMAPCCRESYVRGILAEKVRDHDRDAIRELGAILDGLRVVELDTSIIANP